jgi:hypothetical protein
MDPQMWAAIGVFATFMFAMHRLTVREVSARIDGLEGVMNAKFETVDHRLTALETDMAIVKSSLISQRSA